MKCSNCNGEIKFLNNHVFGSKHRLIVDEKGNPNYDELSSFGSDAFIDEYSCPECGMILFTNENDAVKFLKSG